MIKKTESRSLLKRVKESKRLDRFFRECAKEEHRLHIEQGRRFDELFPEVQKLRSMSMCNDRCLNGTQTIVFIANLRRIGLQRDIVIDYLCGLITFPEFIRRFGEAFKLSTQKRFTALADELKEYLDRIEIEKTAN